MNTKAVGDISQAFVTAALLRSGKIILIPFGDNQRYDLVSDGPDGFKKIQVKTGRLINGAIRFRSCSSYAHRGRARKSYKGDADLFGVYCPDNDKCYIIPVDDVGDSMVSMRISSTRNNQSKKVRLASEYEV